jgi:hypothetical protein
MKLYTVLIAAAAFAEDSGTRGVVPADVVQARPAKPAVPTGLKPVYRPIDKQTVTTLRQSDAARQVGVTIWRLRPSAIGDNGARLLVQDNAGSGEWTPERVSATSSLRSGDRVRLSIESPQPGYLYVIDRERYTSGERGAPYLIFPTTRTRGGDNQVSAGKLVELPGQDDRPNFFSLRPSRPDQREEELTILLAPKPIDDLQIGPNALALPADKVAKWEQQWGGARTEIFELRGGAGKPWSGVEQQAGANATRVLTQDDPPPQSIYRVLAAKPDSPILVKVQLHYGAARLPQNNRASNPSGGIK